VYWLVTDHLINNNVFSNKQFGFKGRSTVMQLLKVWICGQNTTTSNDGQLSPLNPHLDNSDLPICKLGKT